MKPHWSFVYVFIFGLSCTSVPVRGEIKECSLDPTHSTPPICQILSKVGYKIENLSCRTLETVRCCSINNNLICHNYTDNTQLVLPNARRRRKILLNFYDIFLRLDGNSGLGQPMLYLLNDSEGMVDFEKRLREFVRKNGEVVSKGEVENGGENNSVRIFAERYRLGGGSKGDIRGKSRSESDLRKDVEKDLGDSEEEIDEEDHTEEIDTSELLSKNSERVNIEENSERNQIEDLESNEVSPKSSGRLKLEEDTEKNQMEGLETNEVLPKNSGWLKPEEGTEDRLEELEPNEVSPKKSGGLKIDEDTEKTQELETNRFLPENSGGLEIEDSIKTNQTNELLEMLEMNNDTDVTKLFGGDVKTALKKLFVKLNVDGVINAVFEKLDQFQGNEQLKSILRTFQIPFTSPKTTETLEITTGFKENVLIVETTKVYDQVGQTISKHSTIDDTTDVLKDDTTKLDHSNLENQEDITTNTLEALKKHKSSKNVLEMSNSKRITDTTNNFEVLEPGKKGKSRNHSNRIKIPADNQILVETQPKNRKDASKTDKPNPERTETNIPVRNLNKLETITNKHQIDTPKTLDDFQIQTNFISEGPKHLGLVLEGDKTHSPNIKDHGNQPILGLTNRSRPTDGPYQKSQVILDELRILGENIGFILNELKKNETRESNVLRKFGKGLNEPRLIKGDVDSVLRRLERLGASKLKDISDILRETYGLKKNEQKMEKGWKERPIKEVKGGKVNKSQHLGGFDNSKTASGWFNNTVILEGRNHTNVVLGYNHTNIFLGGHNCTNITLESLNMDGGVYNVLGNLKGHNNNSDLKSSKVGVTPKSTAKETKVGLEGVNRESNDLIQRFKNLKEVLEGTEFSNILGKTESAEYMGKTESGEYLQKPEGLEKTKDYLGKTGHISEKTELGHTEKSKENTDEKAESGSIMGKTGFENTLDKTGNTFDKTQIGHTLKESHFGNALEKNQSGHTRKAQFGHPLEKTQLGYPLEKTELGHPLWKTHFEHPLGNTLIGHIGKIQYGHTLGKTSFGHNLGKPHFGHSLGEPRFGHISGKGQFGHISNKLQLEHTLEKLQFGPTLEKTLTNLEKTQTEQTQFGNLSELKDESGFGEVERNLVGTSGLKKEDLDGELKTNDRGRQIYDILRMLNIKNKNKVDEILKPTKTNAGNHKKHNTQRGKDKLIRFRHKNKFPKGNDLGNVSESQKYDPNVSGSGKDVPVNRKNISRSRDNSLPWREFLKKFGGNRAKNILIKSKMAEMKNHLVGSESKTRIKNLWKELKNRFGTKETGKKPELLSHKKFIKPEVAGTEEPDFKLGDVGGILGAPKDIVYKGAIFGDDKNGLDQLLEEDEGLKPVSNDETFLEKLKKYNTQGVNQVFYDEKPKEVSIGDKYVIKNESGSISIWTGLDNSIAKNTIDSDFDLPRVMDEALVMKNDKGAVRNTREYFYITTPANYDHYYYYGQINTDAPVIEKETPLVEPVKAKVSEVKSEKPTGDTTMPHLVLDPYEISTIPHLVYDPSFITTPIYLTKPVNQDASIINLGKSRHMGFKPNKSLKNLSLSINNDLISPSIINDFYGKINAASSEIPVKGIYHNINFNHLDSSLENLNESRMFLDLTKSYYSKNPIAQEKDMSDSSFNSLYNKLITLIDDEINKVNKSGFEYLKESLLTINKTEHTTLPVNENKYGDFEFINKSLINVGNNESGEASKEFASIEEGMNTNSDVNSNEVFNPNNTSIVLRPKSQPEVSKYVNVDSEDARLMNDEKNPNGDIDLNEKSTPPPSIPVFDVHGNGDLFDPAVNEEQIKSNEYPIDTLKKSFSSGIELPTEASKMKIDVVYTPENFYSTNSTIGLLSPTVLKGNNYTRIYNKLLELNEYISDNQLINRRYDEDAPDIKYADTQKVRNGINDDIILKGKSSDSIKLEQKPNENIILRDKSKDKSEMIIKEPFQADIIIKDKSNSDIIIKGKSEEDIKPKVDEPKDDDPVILRDKSVEVVNNDILIRGGSNDDITITTSSGEEPKRIEDIIITSKPEDPAKPTEDITTDKSSVVRNTEDIIIKSLVSEDVKDRLNDEVKLEVNRDASVKDKSLKDIIIKGESVKDVEEEHRKFEEPEPEPVKHEDLIIKDSEDYKKLIDEGANEERLNDEFGSPDKMNQDIIIRNSLDGRLDEKFGEKASEVTRRNEKNKNGRFESEEMGEIDGYNMGDTVDALEANEYRETKVKGKYYTEPKSNEYDTESEVKHHLGKNSNEDSIILSSVNKKFYNEDRGDETDRVGPGKRTSKKFYNLDKEESVFPTERIFRRRFRARGRGKLGVSAKKKISRGTTPEKKVAKPGRKGYIGRMGKRSETNKSDEFDSLENSESMVDMPKMVEAKRKISEAHMNQDHYGEDETKCCCSCKEDDPDCGCCCGNTVKTGRIGYRVGNGNATVKEEDSSEFGSLENEDGGSTVFERMFKTGERKRRDYEYIDEIEINKREDDCCCYCKVDEVCCCVCNSTYDLEDEETRSFKTGDNTGIPFPIESISSESFEMGDNVERLNNSIEADDYPTELNSDRIEAFLEDSGDDQQFEYMTGEETQYTPVKFSRQKHNHPRSFLIRDIIHITNEYNNYTYRMQISLTMKIVFGEQITIRLITKSRYLTKTITLQIFACNSTKYHNSDLIEKRFRACYFLINDQHLMIDQLDASDKNYKSDLVVLRNVSKTHVSELQANLIMFIPEKNIKKGFLLHHIQLRALPKQKVYKLFVDVDDLMDKTLNRSSGNDTNFPESFDITTNNTSRNYDNSVVWANESRVTNYASYINAPRFDQNQSAPWLDQINYTMKIYFYENTTAKPNLAFQTHLDEHLNEINENINHKDMNKFYINMSDLNRDTSSMNHLSSSNLIGSDLTINDPNTNDLSKSLNTRDLNINDLHMNNPLMSDPHINNLHISDLPMSDLPMSDLLMSDLPMSDLFMSDLPTSDIFMSDLNRRNIHEGDLNMRELNFGDLTMSDQDIKDLNINNRNMSDLNMNKRHMSDININKRNMSDLNINKPNMSDLTMSNSNRNDVNLRDQNISGRNMYDINMIDIHMSDLNISDYISELVINYLNMSALNMSVVNMSALNMRDLNTRQLNKTQNMIDLIISDLVTRDLNIGDLNMRHLNMSHLNMSNLNINDLNTNDLNISDLNMSNLNISHLNMSDIFKSDLNMSDLIKSYLNMSVLIRSDLNMSDLNMRDLIKSDLNMSDMNMYEPNKRDLNMRDLYMRDLHKGDRISDLDMSHVDKNVRNMSDWSISGQYMVHLDKGERNMSDESIFGESMTRLNAFDLNITNLNRTDLDITDLNRIDMETTDLNTSFTNTIHLNPVDINQNNSNRVKMNRIDVEIVNSESGKRKVNENVFNLNIFLRQQGRKNMTGSTIDDEYDPVEHGESDVSIYNQNASDVEGQVGPKYADHLVFTVNTYVKPEDGRSEDGQLDWEDENRTGGMETTKYLAVLMNVNLEMFPMNRTEGYYYLDSNGTFVE